MLIITVNTLFSILGIVHAGNFSSSILNFIKIFRRLTTFAHDDDIYFFFINYVIIRSYSCERVSESYVKLQSAPNKDLG